jgi:hypothetical protein
MAESTSPICIHVIRKAENMSTGIFSIENGKWFCLSPRLIRWGTSPNDEHEVQNVRWLKRTSSLTDIGESYGTHKWEVELHS